MKLKPFLYRYRNVIVFVLVIVGSTIPSLFKFFSSPSIPITVSPIAVQTVKTPAHTSPLITIHLAGAVRRPGVYDVAPSLSPLEVVQTYGGGFLPQANLDKVNLAGKLKAHGRLLIPFHKTKVKTKSKKKSKSPKLISLNSATKKQLISLPGIGPKTADAIIRYRLDRGGFETIQDLLHIKGLGHKKVTRLKPFVRL